MTHMGFKVNHQRNMTLKCLPAKTSKHINAHLITLSDEKSGTMLSKGLKKGFVENIGRSGPLLVVSKTQGKSQLSVNPIQTLLLLSCLVIVVYNRPLGAKL